MESENDQATETQRRFQMHSYENFREEKYFYPKLNAQRHGSRKYESRKRWKTESLINVQFKKKD